MGYLQRGTGSVHVSPACNGAGAIMQNANDSSHPWHWAPRMHSHSVQKNDATTQRDQVQLISPHLHHIQQSTLYSSAATVSLHCWLGCLGTKMSKSHCREVFWPCSLECSFLKNEHSNVTFPNYSLDKNPKTGANPINSEYYQHLFHIVPNYITKPCQLSRHWIMK